MNKGKKSPQNLVYFRLACSKLFESYFSVLPINTKWPVFHKLFCNCDFYQRAEVLGTYGFWIKNESFLQLPVRHCRCWVKPCSHPQGFLRFQHFTPECAGLRAVWWLSRLTVKVLGRNCARTPSALRWIAQMGAIKRQEKVCTLNPSFM